MRVDELKNKILQLAIQGKLIGQNENDASAHILLENIKGQKEILIKEKKIRAEKSLGEITDEEKLFELPKGWEWCRLGDIGVYKKGPFGSTITKSMFVPKSNETIKIYEQKNAIQKDWTLGEYYVTKEYFEEKLKGFEVFEGDIIVSCAGTIGETYIMPKGIEKGVINQALMKMTMFDGINVDYFLMYFESILKSTANESSKGSAMKNIPPFDIFKKMLFALPPLEEQKRIVDKVNELFTIIDELNKNKEIMLKNISDTRNKVLQLAIQGKLVEQCKNDEPVEILLKRIEAEKEQLIKDKKIKKEKELPEITEEEKPFELPNGWEWVRLGNVGDWGAGATPSRSNLAYYNGDICWIKTGELNDGYINDSVEKITKLAINECSLRLNKVGDILIAMYGATIGKLGILNIEATTNQACCACTTFSQVYNKYLFIVLLSMREQFKNESFGGAQPNISKQKIVNSVIALPSLEEQRRIVAKVDEIMSYLDELEKTILSEEIM